MSAVTAAVREPAPRPDQRAGALRPRRWQEPVNPGDALVVRDAAGREHQVYATSSIEGPWRNDRRVHDFVGVYVRGRGWDTAVFWPEADVRRPSAEEVAQWPTSRKRTTRRRA